MNEHADDWCRIAGDTQVLLRSPVEIADLCGGAAASGTMVKANLSQDGLVFASRLRAVSLDSASVLLEYSDDPQANEAILAAATVNFQGHCDRGLIEFAGKQVREVVVDQHRCLAIALPEFVLLRQRRAHQRVETATPVSLRFVADAAGPLPFNATIIDISLGGVGAVMLDTAIRLERGTILRGCHLGHPSGLEVEADLEVLYSRDITLSDGKPARFSGCRFVQMTPQIEALIQLFPRSLGT